MKKYLTDNTNNFISDRINNLHLALCIYSSIFWLSEYHSKILVFLLPSMMFNWLMDDNKCWMTRLERYFRINKGKDGEGFIENELKSYNIDIKDINIDKCINIYTYVLFILSYNNAFNNNFIYQNNI
tara:strand:+ start:71 stop:451 length:381 start_codon:yes stop_codon:yes gene_type:complete